MTPIVSFRLPGKFLKVAALFTSTDQCRYILNGVQVEIDGDNILIVATCGRRLFAANVSEHATLDVRAKGRKTFIIPSALIAKMPKDDRTLGLTVELAHHRNQETVFLYTHKTEVSAPAIVGNYPNWKQVVPTVPSQPFEYSCFNARLLQDFAKANNLLDRSVGLTIRQHGAQLAPYTVLPSGCWIGVLMPLRSSLVPVIPEWAKAPTQPAK